MAEGTKKEQLMRRVSAMRQERSTFEEHYQELIRFFKPRRGRFFIQDRNKGEKKHQSIINSHGTRALRKATAGMLAGVMSPARPWFTLEHPDSDMMEYEPVKVWLHKTSEMMRSIFNAGNLYQMAPVMIEEMLLLATGCMSHVDDFDDVARFYTHTVGSYMVAQDDRLKINTVAREFEWTVAQTVRQFGLEKCGTTVKNLYDRGSYDAWVPITHCVYPNDEYREGSPFSVRKKFASTYFEQGDGDKEKLLGEAGFDLFPMYVPRWGTTGEDVLGTDCPGMTSLGDVKQLQDQEKRKSQAIQKMVNPPLHGPASVRNGPVSVLPGGLTTYDMNGDNAKLSPIHEPNISLRDLKEDITRVEMRVDDSFFVDLFLAITQMEGVQPRNQFELDQRNQERLLQLGPVLQHLHGEFLNPLIDRTFSQMIAAGILPPPPPELEEQPLKIEYISSLAQAQRAVATQGIDSVAAFVGGLVTAKLSDGKKFDADQAIDEYAKARGAPPRLIRSDDNVAELRAQEQQQMAAMQMPAMAKDAGSAMKSGAEAQKARTEMVQMVEK